VEDAVLELARAKVAVVPLLAGSGTRLKILEAWAAGVPVVSTSLGAEGLPVRHGDQLLLADGGVEFAEAVSRLLASKELRREVGRAGRLLLEKEFTWETVWKNLDL
jgi:glycosyltransferase involved in cell wall biosynthesis